MNLLGAANYDPVGGAVSKVTTSLLAMTALDTTNLRIAFTVPSHGMVHVRMSGVHHGSTTTAQLFLGVLEGSTLRGRANPTPNLLGTAIATTRTKLEVTYTITGLTPGAVNWDAAYGVEIVSSAGGAIKYGGPNNTTTDDAFGGFNFEIWDPQPKSTAGQLSVDANGRVDVIKVAGTTQTARDLGASVLLSSGTGAGQLDFTSGVVKANLAQILGTALTETAGLLAGGFKKFFNVASPTGTLNSIPDAVPDASGGLPVTGNRLTAIPTIATVTTLTNLPAITSNWLTAAGINASALNGKGDWNIGKTGYALSSAAIQAIWDALTSALTTAGSIGKLLVDNINATITSRASQTSLDTVDDYVDTELAAIKAKTDQLTFTVANQVDSNIQSINDTAIVGNGSGTRWGPA